MIGVEIDAYQDDVVVDSATGERNRGAKLDADNFVVQANGSGIRESIRLMIDVELQKPNILLIEEPETHLHPALETSIMRYLKFVSNDAQVFITTHSTNFIDSGEYTSIQLIKNDKATTSTLIDIERATDVIPEELGVRLSSVFMFEKLVFVEGPSDEDVLRECASTLGCNLSRASVGFVTLGGSRNIHHYAARKTTEFLASRGVEMWFVIDRDENTEEEVRALQAQLGDGRKLRCVPVREIENYFIRPQLINKYISARTLQVTQGVDDISRAAAEDLGVVIDQCANALRGYAFVKYLLRRLNRKIYIDPELEPMASEEELIGAIKKAMVDGAFALSGSAEGLEKAVLDAREGFNVRWSEAKLAVVPGDELLKAVVTRFGVGYRKKRDARQLASMMERSEIPEEVARLLREIVAIV